MSKLTLVKLKEEGRLQSGDTVHTRELGDCTVAYVRTVSSMCVKTCRGEYHTLNEINFGPGELRLEDIA